MSLRADFVGCLRQTVTSIPLRLSELPEHDGLLRRAVPADGHQRGASATPPELVTKKATKSGQKTPRKVLQRQEKAAPISVGSIMGSIVGSKTALTAGELDAPAATLTIIWHTLRMHPRICYVAQSGVYDTAIPMLRLGQWIVYIP